MFESQLIDKCKVNDGEAYRQLMKLYKNKLYGYLWRFSGTEEEADEMFQETLIKAWKGIKKYNEQKKFASWLFTIAHNVAMDYLRNKNKNTILVPIDETNDKSNLQSIDDQMVQKEAIEKINQIVRNLSNKQREVFMLRQNGELSFKEIAEITNQPINTVLSHMRYSIKKIKKQFENENESRKKTVI
jgi:RNA polymerase sigma-70 factor (ECF subfamily)